MSLRVSLVPFHLYGQWNSQKFSLTLQDRASGNRLTTDNGCADTTAQDTFAAPFCPPTSVLHPNHDPNKCIEVKDANYADGTPVQVYVACSQVTANHPIFLLLFFFDPAISAMARTIQRFIFNPDYTTLIRVAGTDLCVAAGSEYCTMLITMN
jgi:hypothetical protein